MSGHVNGVFFSHLGILLIMIGIEFALHSSHSTIARVCTSPRTCAFERAVSCDVSLSFQLYFTQLLTNPATCLHIVSRCSCRRSWMATEVVTRTCLHLCEALER